MLSMTFRVLSAVAFVVVCSLAGCATVTKLNWDYWLWFPSPGPLVDQLTSLRQYTTFPPSDREESGSSALEASAAHGSSSGLGDRPDGALATALLNRQLRPKREEPLPRSLLQEVRKTLAMAGALVEGDSGYRTARDLWGDVALGSGAEGEELVVVGLSGGEVSKNHYPHYHALFSRSPSGELLLLSVNRHWYDVAGDEVALPLRGGIVGFAFGIIFAAVREWRPWRRRRVRPSLWSVML